MAERLLAELAARRRTAKRLVTRCLANTLPVVAVGGAYLAVAGVGTGSVGTALAVAGAALVLTPVRDGAERLVDRLAYGRRPAPYSVLAQLGALSRSGPGDIPDLARVARIVADGLGARSCRLTVIRPGLPDRTFGWPERSDGGPEHVSVPIWQGTLNVGTIAVDSATVAELTPRRRRLLVDVAGGLGAVLQASRLGTELERQLRAALAHAEEIAASRRRAVAEMDSERRKIERNLHDGAQHHLVSLRLTLGLVEHQVSSGAREKALEWLAKLAGQLDTTEAVLAETAAGVFSVVLSRQGLVAALVAELADVHPPVTIDADEETTSSRFPAPIETAVYFCCLEAVNNARKHAPGAPVAVRLHVAQGTLHFSVRDSGPGFVPGAASGGRGMRNVNDRIGAVNGRISVRSAPGAGTTVEGSVRLPPAPRRPPVELSRRAPTPTGPARGNQQPGSTGSGSPPPRSARPAGPPAVRDHGPDTPTIRAPGPNAGRPDPAGPRPAGPQVAGPRTAGPPTAGPPTAGPRTGGPSTAGPRPSAPTGTPPRPRTPGPDPVPPGPAADDATAVAFVPPRVDGRRPLLDQVRDVVRGAAEAYADTPAADRLAEVVARLDGALRVAIAGRVKAGKSTLLNALVGQQIAATDARECTLVHTWYQDGVGYKVMLYPRQGPPRQLPFGQTGADAGVDLGDLTPAEVDRLEVDWPSHALRAMTLIDTPGMGSATAGVSERSEALLTPDDDQPPVVDAIIYLMRHVHANDLRFLQAVQGDPTLGRPMNTVGVLARADEVGHARPDALESAGRVADRYRNDPRVRRLCQTVVPVAGLLASTAATLREAEFRALRQLSALDVEQVEQLLLVAEDFGRAELPAEPDGATRTALLERFGVYGVQLAVELIRTGAVRGPTELSEVLLARSGLQALRELLTSQFAARADLLKARSALLALEGVAREFPQAGARTEWLRYALEQIRSGAHELAELDLIDALRGGLVPLPEQEVAAAERLLGVDGAAGYRRLGLSENATPDELREAAAVALTRWQQRAAHPASAGGVRDAAQVVVRTCEGLLARL